jgi:hypothetical protein
MRWIDASKQSPSNTAPFAWGIAYTTTDVSLASTLPAWASRASTGTLVGCTSSAGVFCPAGFSRGLHLLVADEDEPIRAASALRRCNAISARRAAREAAEEIVHSLGERPSALLLHGTPGFEERILEGIDEAFDGNAPPAYGGSAADDDLSGQWKVFSGARVESQGFVLMGWSAAQTPIGAFVAGYLPTQRRGVVTRATGRVVHEIDGAPAAEVYDQWRDGALDRFLRSTAVVLAETTLHPVGRLIDRHKGTPRYLLSHPHQMHADGSLSFFTDFAKGDELVMMMGTTDSLLERTTQVVHRAKASRDVSLRGAILIYCGGCVLAIGDKTQEVVRLYGEQVKGAAFIGAATFGEIGCLSGASPANRHGNLMCDTLLFR